MFGTADITNKIITNEYTEASRSLVLAGLGEQSLFLRVI
jgi:hypothetical protein